MRNRLHRLNELHEVRWAVGSEREPFAPRASRVRCSRRGRRRDLVAQALPPAVVHWPSGPGRFRPASEPRSSEVVGETSGALSRNSSARIHKRAPLRGRAEGSAAAARATRRPAPPRFLRSRRAGQPLPPPGSSAPESPGWVPPAGQPASAGRPRQRAIPPRNAGSPRKRPGGSGLGRSCSPATPSPTQARIASRQRLQS